MANEADNQGQFEQVLNRLDAFMKRTQAAQQPAATQNSAPPRPESAPAQTGAPQTGTPFVILEKPTDIPLLTEVYSGEISPITAESNSELAEAVIDALMPLLLENLDIIIAEETIRMEQNIIKRMRTEIAATLRARVPTRKA
ncbi:MAG: hypothetical protein LBE24_01715 [Methylobacillus sp.]|jgi:hypothetical protein|nr:hypothetical protein [Methylobacillus sp.]